MSLWKMVMCKDAIKARQEASKKYYGDLAND